MQRLKLYSLLFTCLSMSLSLSAQSAIGTGEVVRLYRAECAVCHGKEMEGGLGGPLVGKLDHADTDEALFSWIKAGNLDLGMPAYEDILTDQQIRSLVIYIRERQRLAALSDEGTSGQTKHLEAGGHTFRVERLQDNLREPWALAFLPDGSQLITEQAGRLLHISAEGERTRIEGIPEVWFHGQGGLLDVAVHPEYEENGWIYLSFSEEVGGEGSTSIVRGRITVDQWVDQEVIFRVEPEHRSSRRFHFGTRIVFQDGYLFFAIGDRGSQNTAQDLASPNGKVHRIHDDGRIPKDNPFVETPGAYPSTWTYGNRNAQGLDLHPLTGELWESEHGPRGGDEINLLRKGLNYGWPLVTFGMNYNGSPITEKTHAPGIEPPALQWTPSIAVCGIAFYKGERFPNWNNNLFAGGLSTQQLHRLVIEDGTIVKDEVVLRGLGRIRDVTNGPDGYLYLVLNGPDQIVRLVPTE